MRKMSAVSELWAMAANGPNAFCTRTEAKASSESRKSTGGKTAMKAIVLLLLALALLSPSAASRCSAEATEASSDILIAYFTWADNTVVENEEASIQSALDHYSDMGDPDSAVEITASASLLVPGNTAIMARFIHDVTGGDLFSIQVETPYPDQYDECLERAAEELDGEARPALKTHVENMEQYDTVFLGMPNWWYSCPMAIKSFIEAYDFSGKTIVPFVAHGTGGISRSVQDMRECLSDTCTVLEAIGVYRPDVPDCQPEVEQWLRRLGF